MSLKNKINVAMKEAMRERNQPVLSVIRMLQAAIKQVEVDERIEVDDGRILTIIAKMIKQRQESEQIFQKAGRIDLAQKEQFEWQFLDNYRPKQLNEQEINEIVLQKINELDVKGMGQMGQLMAQLKSELSGIADMGLVSTIVKKALQK